MIGIRCFPPQAARREHSQFALKSCPCQPAFLKHSRRSRSHRRLKPTAAAASAESAVELKRNRLVSPPPPSALLCVPSHAQRPLLSCHRHRVTVTLLWPRATSLLAQQGRRAKRFESRLLSLRPGPGKPREGALEGRMLRVSHLEDRLERARFRTSGVSSDVGTGGEPPNSDLLSLSDAVSPSSLFSDSDSCKLKRDKELY